MIHTSKDNWFRWYYDDELYGRQDYNNLKKLRYEYDKNSSIIGSFKQELISNASSTIDYFNGERLTLLFSGGLDSELVLRSYLELNYPINVIIYRYENDYNIYDVSYAVVICNMLKVPYKIVDFDLENFLQREAVDISEIAQIDRPRGLIHCKLLEITEGIPILGTGDPEWMRTTDDYTVTGNWMYGEIECFIGWEKYARAIEKPCIPQWLKWTSGVTKAYANLDWFKKLTSDNFMHRTGVDGTKILGYREAFPNIIARTKKHGFEKIDNLINELESSLKSKYNDTLPFRNDIFISQIDFNQMY